MNSKPTDTERPQAQLDNSSTLSKKAPLLPPGPLNNNKEISELTAEIRGLRSEVSTIQSQIKEVLDKLSFHTERLENISNRISDNESRIKSLEDKQVQTAELQETVSRLQDQLNKQEQVALRNEIEIVGCPESPNENPIHIVLTTAAKIGVTLTHCDVDAAWRAGPRLRSARSSGMEGVNHRIHPRPIAIRFIRRATRDEFLKAAKTRRNVTTEDLVLNDKNPQKIFVNERLTRENRQLFRAARQRATVAKFKYCWTSSGSVYVRKHDAAAAIHIRNPLDLDRIAGDSNKESENPYAAPGISAADPIES
ncbi:uncharacterized protein LOC134652332 [Cydia amplana]|uniref:uncharacterized protein LOC134652332 n=1 Tax=Cydia amplana TaxID=1869771 RepID=UPI002FE6BBBF